MRCDDFLMQRFLGMTVCVAMAGLLAIAIPRALAEQAQDSTNGYAIGEFGDFIKDWRFVTSRYREDTGEMRLTYANEIAWKALASGETDYPDGSVFAKIGVQTMPDPAFLSSAEPAGAKRFQLMVRDREKHKDTDGWGYALFDMKGKAKELNFDFVNACHTCHQLVPERGYIFSRVMHLDVGIDALDALLAQPTPAAPVSFEQKPAATAPSGLRALLPEGTTRIRFVTGPLTTNLFQGTLDEIRPTLAAEALKTGIPAALVSEDGSKFVFLRAEKETECSLPDGRRGHAMTGALTTKSDAGRPIVMEIDYCKAR